MCKSSLGAALLITMFLTGLTVATAPETAVAQMDSDAAFSRRMNSRIYMMQAEIKRLDHYVQEGNYENYGGITQQLEQLEEGCKQYERELRYFGSTSIGGQYEKQRQRRNIEYAISGMEQQVQALRKYIRALDEETEKAEAKKAEEEALEEELSEDEWAEEWAKGKD